jgi:hypothetical protein
VSRSPSAIRIGKHRKGSKTGVLAYSQEHAREWVTPLVVVETADRLLRNYRNDAATRRLVDDLDIFPPGAYIAAGRGAAAASHAR